MTRYLITKRTLQVAAVLVGLFGGFFAYIGVGCLFVFAPFRDGVGGVLLLLSTVLDLLLGGVFLGIAYKVLKGFSPGAIRYLLVILAFIFFSLLGLVLEPLRRILDERKAVNLLLPCLVLLPLIATWLFYKIMTAMVTVGLRREGPPTGTSE